MNLDTNDAVELAELLQFLHDWLGTDPGRSSESLNDFAGAKTEWRSDGPTPDNSELD